MDYEYSKRNYLLPEGCKDLIDVIQAVTAITEWGFVVTARLPGLKSEDIAITVTGSTLRISARQGGSPASFGKAVEVPVPGNYALAKAHATYLRGRLRIVVPKAAG